MLLLNNSWNRSLAPTFGIFKIILQLCLVVGIYVTLRLFGSLHFSIYIINPMMVLIVLLEDSVATAAMAGIYEKSKDVKVKLNSAYTDQSKPLHKNCLYARRKIAALKPIQCKAILFFFERKTKLLVIGFLMNLTAYALLSFWISFDILPTYYCILCGISLQLFRNYNCWHRNENKHFIALSKLQS